MVRNKHVNLWRKGRPGGPGRPKGKLNKKTVEIRDFARNLMGGLFKDPNYAAALRDRIMRGKESPVIIQMLLAYGYGKPPDKIVLEDAGEATGGPSRRAELIERLCARFTQVGLKLAASEGTLITDDKKQSVRSDALDRSSRAALA